MWLSKQQEKARKSQNVLFKPIASQAETTCNAQDLLSFHYNAKPVPSKVGAVVYGSQPNVHNYSRYMYMYNHGCRWFSKNK